MKLSNHNIKVSFVRLKRDPQNTTDPMAFHATVETPAGTFSTDWKVGVGHAKYLTAYGNKAKGPFHVPGGGLSMFGAECLAHGIARYKPVPEDLICHILAFSDALDTTFPEWAENMGDSADSISAKASYETYQQQNIILRNAFGDTWDAMVEYAQEQ